MKKMDYDVIIIGAGPGGIFSAYELMTKAPNLKVAVYEAGTFLEDILSCFSKRGTFHAF